MLNECCPWTVYIRNLCDGGQDFYEEHLDIKIDARLPGHLRRGPLLETIQALTPGPFGGTGQPEEVAPGQHHLSPRCSIRRLLHHRRLPGDQGEASCAASRCDNAKVSLHFEVIKKTIHNRAWSRDKFYCIGTPSHGGCCRIALVELIDWWSATRLQQLDAYSLTKVGGCMSQGNMVGHRLLHAGVHREEISQACGGKVLIFRHGGREQE
jgi:hypothetical protein